MKFKNILLAAALCGTFTGCLDMDIPPKNIITSEDIYNEASTGTASYGTC